MAGKLYWRYKKNGKWTWRPAKYTQDLNGELWVVPFQEEEE